MKIDIKQVNKNNDKYQEVNNTTNFIGVDTISNELPLTRTKSKKTSRSAPSTPSSVRRRRSSHGSSGSSVRKLPLKEKEKEKEESDTMIDTTEESESGSEIELSTTPKKTAFIEKSLSHFGASGNGIKRKIMFIPYLGVILKDLVSIDEYRDHDESSEDEVDF